MFPVSHTLRGLAVGALLVAGCSGAWAQSAPPAPENYGPWGFDRSGADLTVRPGDDFFRHANGAWLDRTPIAPDRRSAGVGLELDNLVEARVRGILEAGAAAVEPGLRSDAAKIAALYAAFMDEGRIETLDGQPIAGDLAKVRAATSREDLAGMMGSSFGTFMGTLFSYAIEVDAKDPTRYVVKLGQAGLGLPDRDYYLEAQFADKKSAYLAYIAQMLALAGWEEPQRYAAAILALETQIAEASWSTTDQRDSFRTYNAMSVEDLERFAPFPWRRLLDGAQVGAVQRVVIAENTAFPVLARLFEQTPVDVLKAWMAFQLVDHAAPYLSRRFVEASFAFREKTLTGVAALPDRWKRGVRFVDTAMGEAVGRVYAARYFSEPAKAQVDSLVAQLRAAFKHRIEQLEWMSAETKARALEKLARIGTKIAYPNKWRDYSSVEVRPDDLVGSAINAWRFEWLRKVKRLGSPVDREEWFTTAHTVNAFYDPTMNDVSLPAAQLQAPIFNPDADPAVNYGAIGVLLGHELTHGFDDDGRKYDAAGVLSEWWAEPDVAAFQSRATRLARQYDAYEPFPGVHVNGSLTLGENIADLGGVLIALDAYRNSLAGKPAPVIDGYTGEQRFFLGYAQMWRTKRREDAVREQLVSDPHAPDEYRVNGVLRNVDAWYEAFDVKPGEKLFLPREERVRIW